MLMILLIAIVAVVVLLCITSTKIRWRILDFMHTMLYIGGFLIALFIAFALIIFLFVKVSAALGASTVIIIILFLIFCSK